MPTSNDRRPRALCFGEVLFDRFADGAYLGGATLNFAWYLNQCDVATTMVSAVGRDELGDGALQTLRQAGIDTSLIARLNRPTGVVDVTLDDGEPQFHLQDDTAWDYIPLPPAPLPPADLLYFGSAAQRSAYNRATLQRLLAPPARFAHCFFDVNLRPPHYQEASVLDGLQRATTVKVNEEEWEQIKGLAAVADADELLQRYGVDQLVVTRGEAGASLYRRDRHVRALSPQVEVVDAVGAGDACSAVLAAALLHGRDLPRHLAMACRAGAFVVGQRGAQTRLPADLCPGAPQ